MGQPPPIEFYAPIKSFQKHPPLRFLFFLFFFTNSTLALPIFGLKEKKTMVVSLQAYFSSDGESPVCLKKKNNLCRTAGLQFAVGLSLSLSIRTHVTRGVTSCMINHSHCPPSHPPHLLFSVFVVSLSFLSLPSHSLFIISGIIASDWSCDSGAFVSSVM